MIRSLRLVVVAELPELAGGFFLFFLSLPWLCTLHFRLSDTFMRCECLNCIEKLRILPKPSGLCFIAAVEQQQQVGLWLLLRSAESCL